MPCKQFKKIVLGASQSAQFALPMTVDLSDWIEAASTKLFILDLDLLLSLPCSELRIWCSMAVTHSSRSSTLEASKCQILLSRDTIWNSKPSESIGRQIKRN